MEALVGDPPQKQSLIVDTGSHLIIFPCSKCENCGIHDYPLFDEKKSNSFEKIKKSDEEFNWTCPMYSRGKCRFL